MTTMDTRTLALGLSLLMTSALPAFASAEAPVSGEARVLAAPAYVANGDAAPVFAPASGTVQSGTAALALSAEATVGPKA
jgi:hypothetical protein